MMCTCNRRFGLYLFEWFISAKGAIRSGSKLDEYSVSNTRCRFGWNLGESSFFALPFFRIAPPPLIRLMLSENIFFSFIRESKCLLFWCSERPLPMSQRTLSVCVCVQWNSCNWNCWPAHVMHLHISHKCTISSRFVELIIGCHELRMCTTSSS